MNRVSRAVPAFDPKEHSSMTASRYNDHLLAEDISSRAITVKSFPSVMYIEATRGCPYTCIMCKVPDEHGRKSVDVSQDLLDRVSPYFQYLEILGIHLYGEPLLSRNIDYFIEATRTNDCFLHMNSTGFLLRPKLADRLLATKLHIIFSIHAGTSASYRKIMGQDLQRVIDNISYLTGKSARSGSPDNEFWFSYIVVKETVNEIEDFLLLAHRAGVSKVRFMKLDPNLKILKGAHRDAEDFVYRYHQQFNREVGQAFLEQLPRVRERAQELGITIETGNMEFAAAHGVSLKQMLHRAPRLLPINPNMLPLVKRRVAPSRGCLAPWTGQIQIGQDGNVNLCCSARYSLGNVFEKSLEEIWNDHRIRTIRGDFHNGLFPRTCGYCKGMPADEYGVKIVGRHA